ncbi:hypothetical protein NKI25_33125 [Mesorhizobium sp. M0808]|uniref:ankyrin repeat domain-containing protein n=1 Tax=Mesorhizobium sp. M0808 TaxID=2957002 RepID=UPI0033385C07
MVNWNSASTLSPLFAAIASDDLASVKDQVENYGADLNMPTSNGEREYTPIAWAASSKVTSSDYHVRAQIIDYLFLQGSNIAVGGPLVECRDFECAELMLKYGAVADQSVVTASGDAPTALVGCCEDLLVDIVELLLKYGAIADVKLPSGISLLYSVCLASLYSNQRKALEIVKLLQKSGADLEATDSAGATILSHVVSLYSSDRKGSPNGTATNLVGLLLNLGADVGHRDPDASTVLIQAVRNPAARLGGFEMIDLIFAYGGDSYVDVFDRDGLTPLHYLVHFDSETYDRFGDTAGLIELFFSRGASVDVRDNSGRTAFFRLVGYLCPAPGSITLYPPPRPGTPGRYAALNILRQLKAHRADAKLADHRGRTPLTVAKAAGKMGQDVQGYCY